MGQGQIIRRLSPFSAARPGGETRQPLPGSANILYAAFLSTFRQEARSLSKGPLSAVEAEIAEFLVFRPRIIAPGQSGVPSQLACPVGANATADGQVRLVGWPERHLDERCEVWTRL